MGSPNWTNLTSARLYEAQSETWSTNRDQKREQRKDRQLTHRFKMSDETTGHEFANLQIPIARLTPISMRANCEERGRCYRE